jgi:hypothetical protein
MAEERRAVHGGGSFVESYVVAGGAPIPITDWTHLGGPSASTPPSGINPVTVDETALGNAGSGGPYNHLQQMPADGTIVAGNADKTNGIFVIAGGAPIYVSNWEDIGGAVGRSRWTRPLSMTSAPEEFSTTCEPSQRTTR